MPTLTRHLALGAAAALWWIPCVTGAQESEATPPDGVFEEEIEVTEVLLDVLVTDGRGNVIVGLGKEDFVVEDQGTPVELTGVTFYSNRRFLGTVAGAAPTGVDADEVPTDRYFVLFFHDQRQSAPEVMALLMDAARASKRWVQQEMLPNDHVAVVSYDHKLKVHRDFTRDQRAVESAIDGVVRGKDPGAIWPSRLEGDGPSLSAHLPQGPELRRQTFEIHKGLQVLADGLGGLQGRKNVLFYSLGFGEVDEADTYSPDPRWYPNLVQTMNDHNVAIYAIDLLPSGRAGSQAARTLNHSLSDLASETGGRYYFHFNNFSTPLAQVTEDTNGYYLLSYTSRFPRGESGYRKVEVKARNPDFEVRARQGYRYGQGS